LDKAEYALFDELQVKYTRHSAYPNGVRGYRRFEAEWNLEVANRCRDKLTSIDGLGVDIQIVHRKTYLHLQTHYNNLESKKRTAALAGMSDGAVNRLHFQLRDLRREMAPHQEAHQCAPITYQHAHNAVPQMGNPTILNTSITANAFTHNQQQNAGTVPFQHRTQQQNATALSTVNGFKRGTYCYRCGWRKKDHCHLYKFGRDCAGNVGRDECSKCFMRLEFHNVGQIGPHCAKTAHKNSDCDKWYPNVNQQSI